MIALIGVPMDERPLRTILRADEGRALEIVQLRREH